MLDVDRCVYCGQAIPEGKQICPECELAISQTAPQRNRNRYKKRMTTERLKKIIIVVALIGAIIGAGAGVLVTYICRTTPENNNNTGTKTSASNIPPYSTRDGKVFSSEMSIDWVSNLDFTPIDCTLHEELQEFTYYLSQGYYIDFSFVMGLMYCESSFRTDCISGTDDYGLMQINAQNHEWLSEQLGLDDITDPYQNIRAGLYILRKLFEKYDDPAKVTMAYNMGEYGASQLWKQGVYKTTYSKKVLAKADEYKTQLENNTKK